MTRIIELNDRAIQVGDESGIFITSPGFALVEDKLVELGEQAEKQARLKPTSSYNKYWQQLSLDPLPRGMPFRHYADIAHAHLSHLAETGQIESDVIFAVPASYSRDQLSILLGLARHSPLNPVGLVDSALAASLAVARARTVIYADLQLHQVVLTRLRHADEQLQTESVIQIPGVGSQSFMDLMMQIATRQFIEQCRFNPQHNAESEQQLYNALPAWLKQDQVDENLLLELNSGGNTYNAKMPRESLVSSLGGHYGQIRRQIETLAGDHAPQLILSRALGDLPGLRAAMSGYDVVIVEPESVTQTCLEYRQLISGGEQGLQRVTALPSNYSEAVAITARGHRPTHILHGHRALPLGNLQIRNGKRVNGHGTGEISIEAQGLPEQLGRIRREQDGIYLDSGEQEFFINAEKRRGRHKLELGDTIQFSAGGDSLSVIEVSHGQ